jgi:hypothetical protein
VVFVRDYVLYGVVERGSVPVPPWVRRVQIWSCGEVFVVNCDYVSMEAATDLLVESLLFVLNKRGRRAEPLRNDSGEVTGMRW